MPRIPLLKDNHNHFFIYAMLADSINLQSIAVKERAIELIKKNPGNQVGVVLGWNDSLYTFSSIELDLLPPLVVCNLSLHGFLMNTRAREMLRDRDEELIIQIGNPAWCEKNLPRILGFLATLTPLNRDRIFRFLSGMEQKGIWISEDMFVSDTNYLNFLLDSGLDGRISPWTDLGFYGRLPERLKSGIRGIKIFSDGALGQRTAALKVPYLNGDNGLLNFTSDELDVLIRDALKVHDSVSIHAIGDRAIAQVLNSVERHRDRNKEALIRIEHCQFISPENAFKAKKLGVVLSMQPNFSSDSVGYRDRLPEGYAEKNNPFRMLIDDVGFVPGLDLVFGSDGMPHGVQVALEQSLFPRFDSQKLTLEEFQAGYCIGNFDPGSIEVVVDQKHRRIKTSVKINK